MNGIFWREVPFHILFGRASLIFVLMHLDTGFEL